MTEKKLQSFKISATQKPRVVSTAKGKSDPPPAPSLGFSRLEKVLETEDAASVGQTLSGLLKQLEDVQAKAATPKDKAGAKKAIVAVERVVDLIDYLFQTKASLAHPKI